MQDDGFEAHLPDDLRDVADGLRSARSVPDGHLLERVERRVLATASPKGFVARLRPRLVAGVALVALIAVFVSGGLHGVVPGAPGGVHGFSLASLVSTSSTDPTSSGADDTYCDDDADDSSTCTCPNPSSITSNFNGTPIVAGHVIWFTAVFKVKGLPPSGGTLQFTSQTISGVPGVPGGTVTPPNSQITISPGATPSATFTGGMWVITLPTGFSGNGLLAAVSVNDTNGTNGGGSPTWTGSLSSSAPGVTINWQWAAATYYPGFPTNPALYNTIGVTALDGQVGGDHAGTPENEKGLKDGGGATGGGGSNYTGSYSATRCEASGA